MGEGVLLDLHFSLCCFHVCSSALQRLLRGTKLVSFYRLDLTLFLLFFSFLPLCLHKRLVFVGALNETVHGTTHHSTVYILFILSFSDRSLPFTTTYAFLCDSHQPNLKMKIRQIVSFYPKDVSLFFTFSNRFHLFLLSFLGLRYILNFAMDYCTFCLR